MRVLVLSDIHANLVALETVLSAAAGKYDALWCLGDIVGYGPRPNECIEIIRDKAAACVIGNHDWAALERPGINVDDFNPHARFAVLWTRDQLSQPNRAFLDSLADAPIRPIAGESVLMTHASPREPVWEYILAPSTALENFMEFDEEICLVGHTHKPAIYAWQMLGEKKPANGSRSGVESAATILTPERTPERAPVQNGPAGRDPASTALGDDETRGSVADLLEEVRRAEADPDEVDEAVARGETVVSVSALQPQPNTTIDLRTAQPTRLIINPGSVGQPRDNDARASYAILDLDRGTWRYERIAYPIELTQGQMREAHLPRRLIDRLSFGW